MLGKSIIVDVGANYGGFSLEIAKRNPCLHVLAIEAEPVLANTLLNQASQMELDNHDVINFAVNEIEGEFDFHVSELGDHGTSSLLQFSENNITRDEYWKERTDLYHSKTFKVQAVTLEKILDSYDPVQIKFIKIDVQGLDLTVLKSAGRYLDKVQAGMLEVPSVICKSLYSSTNEDLREALNFLEENNFDVYAIKPNDPASNEFNVFFTKKGLDFKEIEADLQLNDFHFYDGKHFWHAPSHKLENPEQHILNLNDVLKKKESELEHLRAEIKDKDAAIHVLQDNILDFNRNIFVKILKKLNLVEV